jgi:RNA polymerase sigma factor (TIGR02999 family)
MLTSPAMNPASGPSPETPTVPALGSGTDPVLLPRIYEELRRLAGARLAREGPHVTLQATVLVHEAWLRLGGDAQPAWQNRAHFFGAAAEAMRRILIDRARRRQARRRAGLTDLDDDHEAPENRVHVVAPDDRLLAVHEALDGLAEEDPQAAELVKLRYFAGMSMPEVADATGLSLRAAERIWTFARAWLRAELDEPPEEPNPTG